MQEYILIVDVRDRLQKPIEKMGFVPNISERLWLLGRKPCARSPIPIQSIATLRTWLSTSPLALLLRMSSLKLQQHPLSSPTAVAAEWISRILKRTSAHLKSHLSRPNFHRQLQIELTNLRPMKTAN